MISNKPTSISHSLYFEAFIRKQIESGRYSNTSEIIRAGLRALEEREQQLQLKAGQKAVNACMNSGESRNAEKVFTRLSRKYRLMAKDDKA